MQVDLRAKPMGETPPRDQTHPQWKSPMTIARARAHTPYKVDSRMVPANEPCAHIADQLIDALEQSNGLEFMPINQRMRLISLLSEDAPYVLND